VTTGPQATAMAIDSLGRIVVADGVRDFVLARYNADGTPDGSFGSGGETTTDFGGPDDRVEAMAIDSRGRIVVAGQADRCSTCGINFALARYKPDGSLDGSFGSGGKVMTSFGKTSTAFSMAIGSRGRIVTAGTVQRGGSRFALAPYNRDGSLDGSFGTRGKVRTWIGYPAGAQAVAIDSLGRIVAAGLAHDSSDSSYVHFDFALARYNRDGSLDTAFSGDGKVTTNFRRYDLSGDFANAVAIDSRDRILAAGESDEEFALARYIGEAPPKVKISGPATVRTRHRRASARFSFKANEPVGFKCKVDSARFRRCTSPYETPRLRVGSHRFKLRATDRARNQTTRTKRFKVVKKR